MKGLLFAAIVISGAIAAPLAQVAPPPDDDVAKYVRALLMMASLAAVVRLLHLELTGLLTQRKAARSAARVTRG
jgi:hypothetical protein